MSAPNQKAIDNASKQLWKLGVQKPAQCRALIDLIDAVREQCAQIAECEPHKRCQLRCGRCDAAANIRAAGPRSKTEGGRRPPEST